MTGIILALALGGWAWGQETAGAQSAVAAVEASSSTAFAVEASTPAAPEAPKAAPRLRVHVHPDAADWEPVSVRFKEDTGASRTFCEIKVRKLRGAGFKGAPSPAKASVRSHPVKEDRWLVVSVYPAGLRPKRTHLEARFLIQEGYLEEVKVAAVSVVGGVFSPEDEKEDSFSLREKGTDFIERSPGSAEVELSGIDPQAGREAVNSGRVKFAAFGDKDLGFVNFGWSARGVSGAKPVKPAKMNIRR